MRGGFAPFAARIRAGGGPDSHAPILALTANADPADAADDRLAGLNGVVEKPVKPERLLAAMNAVLQVEPAHLEHAEVEPTDALAL